MKLLDRYIMRSVVVHSLMVLAVMVGLYFFSSVIREMSHVGKGNYSTEDAIIYSVMLLPRQVYELFPLVALIGSMLGLGALASHSELTVMRSAGVSIRRISLSVVKAGLMMIAIVIVIGETAAPALEQEANTLRLDAMARGVSFNTGERMWAKDGDSFISIRWLELNGEARGVDIYQMEGQRLQRIASAAQARYGDGEWRLSDVTLTLFSEQGVRVEQREALAWPSELAPGMINLASMEPENLSIWELNRLVGFMQENDLASQRYEVAMWVRLFAPLSIGGMLLLALPFVFGSLRDAGAGARVMFGALIGIAFYLVNNVFARMGLLYDIPPAVSAATPALLVFVLWWLMMRRVH